MKEEETTTIDSGAEISGDDRSTVLTVRVKTAKRLQGLKEWGESYDKLLNRLLDRLEKGGDERDGKRR